MSATNKGELWTYSGPAVLEWVRGQGTTQSGVSYEAQTEAAASGIFQSLKATHDRVRMEKRTDGTYAVVATKSGDEQNPESDGIVDTHELLGNVLQQSIGFNAVLQEKLTAEQIAYVVKESRNVKAGKYSLSDAYGNISAEDDPAFNGVADGDARALLDDLVQDADSFINSQFVYRHTFNIQSGAAVSLNLDNVNCYWETTADMLDGEGITLPDDFELPEGEWLKIVPTITKQYGQRTQAVYEYWYADVWSRIKYAPAS